MITLSVHIRGHYATWSFAVGQLDDDAESADETGETGETGEFTTETENTETSYATLGPVAMGFTRTTPIT